MDKRFNELLENVKNQILDVFPEMDRDDREEFFNRLNECLMRNMRKPCWKASWKRQIMVRSMRIDGLTTKTI